MRGITDRSHPGRNVHKNDASSPDPCIVTNAHRAQDLRRCTDIYSVSEHRWKIVACPTPAYTESHTLTQSTEAPNDRPVMDH